MEGITPLIAYAVALSVAAIIPGPGVAALIGQSLGAGLRSSLFFIIGIALGDLIYLTVAVAGLAAIAQFFGGVFLIVKIFGGAYLIYLAFKLWTEKSELTHVRESRYNSGFRAFLAGFVVTLGNPKTMVFYLALLPTVLNLETIGMSKWMVLSVITVLVLFATMLPYAFLASRARRAMVRPRAFAKLNKSAACFIGSAGIVILGQAAAAVARRS